MPIVLNKTFALLPGSHFAILAIGRNGERLRIELKHSFVASDIVTIEVKNEQDELICLPEYLELYRTVSSKHSVPGSGREF